MAEDDRTAAEIAEQNRRKLAEHLERLRRGKGREDAAGEEAGATGPEGGAAPEAGGPQTGAAGAGPDPAKQARWEAWKRTHGHRIHEVREDESKGPAEQADYKLLGVTPQAGREEIRRAYYRLAKTNHPDQGGDPEKFRALRLAYDRVMKARGG